MNKLYFCKIVLKDRFTTASDVVFCFTATDEDDAKVKGLAQINPDYVNEYKVDKVEFMCNTPDEVLCFEPC